MTNRGRDHGKKEEALYFCTSNNTFFPCLLSKGSCISLFHWAPTGVYIPAPHPALSSVVLSSPQGEHWLLVLSGKEGPMQVS